MSDGEGLANPLAVAALRARPLEPEALLDGELLVFGGTGFLGKVWLAMLLDRCPNVHVHLVVRPKGGLSSDERFVAEIAPSGVFGGADVTGRITPLGGDVSEAFAGVSDADRERLRGRLQAVVNVAGVVDFNPPLDHALKVNAYGMQNLVSLVEDLGSPPLLHTSTCYVAGMRAGQVDEVDPRAWPFPKADQLTDAHWDPDREVAECADLIDGMHRRAQDAFRRSLFEREARARLEQTGEPLRGSALRDAISKAERRWLDDELADIGRQRAEFWGWPNTYTYTKSIGEQILASSGLRFAITRPAVVESALRFPEPGWNEGITTSAPIMYLSMKGMTGMPAGDRSVLDVIPVDVVSAGMLLALAELVEGTAAPVYQLGTSDTNPLKMTRLIELTGLYKRRRAREGRGDGGPLWQWLQGTYETVPVTEGRYLESGPSKTAAAAKNAAGWLRGVGDWVPAVRGLASAAADAADGLGKQASGTARVVDQFLPFVARHDYRFSCANARAARARLTDEGRERFRFDPEDLDWRRYWLDVHVPGVERHVWPRIEDRLRRERKPLRAHDDLVALLIDAAERFGDQPALQLRTEHGFATRTYRGLLAAAQSVAGALVAAGLEAGDRVLLAGRNHPDWAAAWFGVVWAGGVVVPVDRELPTDDVGRIVAKAGVRLALLDGEAAARFGCVVPGTVLPLDAQGSLAAPVEAEGDGPAAILFTSGTTGDPKGVVLTHRNFCSLLASLSRVFDVGADDRVLSVLPLHHTFEFSCGLLLPLSRGARIVYLDELTGEALAGALGEAQITAMVGVPALWQLLERRIAAQAAEQGWLASRAFDLGLELNRVVGRSAGLDLGRLLFGAVHDRLGGNIRLLISGGAALPADTHKFFAGLGLPLAEGYGLTEAAPVLTASAPKPGGRRGAGAAIPGVEVQVVDADEAGVGRVVARGPNVMAGYYGDEQATAAVVKDGWLETGDLGRMDHRGRLEIVGRAKDVVVTAAGENLYLDDLEERLGRVSGVSELALVGLADPRGGERLGLLAVAEAGVIHDAVREGLRDAIADRLAVTARPAVVHVVDAELPRTATRKVKRGPVAEILGRIADAHAAALAVPEDAPRSMAVRRAVAQVAGVDAGTIAGGTRLTEELTFDSLMWVELAAALDELPGGQPAAEALARCQTVADVEALVEAPALPALVEDVVVEERVFRFPGPSVGALRKALRAGQRFGYEQGLRVRVSGRAFIPHNRPVLVVSNHCSHLDMGLVKTALGSYGEEMLALAASDYFFEGHPVWVAYFEQLTNLRGMPRATAYRQSLRQAMAAVAEGRVTLIFPEGGRQDDGQLHDFKPLVGKLVLESGVDVLPLWLQGTHDVLPKGAVLPKGRDVSVRIGPVLTNADLQRLGAEVKPTRAPRRVTEVLHRAVAALRDGTWLDAATLESWEPAAPARAPLEVLFEQLPARFVPGGLDRSVSWYLSLGDGQKWSVTADGATCTVSRGKPSTGVADCVIKTSPALWMRMVNEAWAPDPAEFVAGRIKTSDIPLLLQFAQAFRLGPPDGDGAEARP